MVTTVLHRGITLKIKKTLANVCTLQVNEQTRFSLRGWNSGYHTLTDSRPGRVEVWRTAKQLVKRNSLRRVTVLSWGKEQASYNLGKNSKFVRYDCACSNSLVLPLISDTNPDGQHVSLQGTHLFLPSISFTMPRIEVCFRQNFLIMYIPLSSGGK